MVLEIEADNSVEPFARSRWEMRAWEANVALVGRVLGESLTRARGTAAFATATVTRKEAGGSGCRLRVPKRS